MIVLPQRPAHGLGELHAFSFRGPVVVRHGCIPVQFGSFSFDAFGPSIRQHHGQEHVAASCTSGGVSLAIGTAGVRGVPAFTRCRIPAHVGHVHRPQVYALWAAHRRLARRPHSSHSGIASRGGSLVRWRSISGRAARARDAPARNSCRSWESWFMAGLPFPEACRSA